MNRTERIFLPILIIILSLVIMWIGWDTFATIYNAGLGLTHASIGFIPVGWGLLILIVGMYGLYRGWRG